MSKDADGGPAFPLADWKVNVRDGAFQFAGMSLRDYFAAAALQGILSAQHTHFDCAPRAYLIADAMLAEREKGEK